MLLFLGAFTFLISCNESGGDSEENQNASTAKVEELKPKTNGDHAKYSFLTNGYLVNNATVKVGEDPKINPYEGTWFKLEADGTFSHGLYQETDYNGYWDYDAEKELLQFTPADESMEKSEWKVMHNSQMVVLAGTRTFENNGTQMRFRIAEQKPAKE